MAVRVLRFSRSFAAGAAVDLGAALSLAMQRLGAFCVANNVKYASTQWGLDVEPSTNVLTFSFSAVVFPAIFASPGEALEAQGGSNQNLP